MDCLGEDLDDFANAQPFHCHIGNLHSLQEWSVHQPVISVARLHDSQAVILKKVLQDQVPLPRCFCTRFRDRFLKEPLES